MSHVKSLTIQFHAPKDMMPDLGQPPDAMGTGNRQPAPEPQTQLDPLQETLFKSWAMANGVQKPDDPNNHFDLRGMYQQTGGRIQAPGVVNNLSSGLNRAMGGLGQAAGPEAGAMAGPAAAGALGALGGQLGGAMGPTLQAPGGAPMGGSPEMGGGAEEEPIQQLLAMIRQKAQF